MSRWSEEDDDEMADLTGPPQLEDPPEIVVPLVRIRFTDLKDLWRQVSAPFRPSWWRRRK